MCGGQVFPAALRVLEQCLSGEVPEANGLPQLLHLHRNSPKEVLAALSEKANAAVVNADAGVAATRAGGLLVRAASFLDGHAGHADTDTAPAKPDHNKAQAPEKGKNEAIVLAGGKSESARVSSALLDHVLKLTGGPEVAAKDKGIRAQGCGLVSALATSVPEHKGAEEKLVEFALDKVPSIREKAVRGLSAMPHSPAAQQALAMRTTDPCTAVRALAVAGLSVTGMTVATLLERIDDVEACVRAQLFYKLRDQPRAVDDLGAATLVRLVAGVQDRSPLVRAAAGQALDAWHAHLGGALAILSRCDIMEDEMLGEVAASALAQRFPEEGRAAALAWLGRGEESPLGHDAKEGALLARLAATAMPEAERDETIDMPSLLQRTRGALEGSLRQKDLSCRWQGYLLRQLLHVLALADVTCDDSVQGDAELLAEDVLRRVSIASATGGTTEQLCDLACGKTLTALDLAIVILRKCCGLSQSSHAQSAKHQVREAKCSRHVVLLLSDLCEPLEEEEPAQAQAQAAAKDASEGLVTTRLSLKLQTLNAEVEQREKQAVTLQQEKAKAVKEEDYLEANRLKVVIDENSKELARLSKLQTQVKHDRDHLCLRVLAIASALLRWSNSEVRRDPALWGILESILRPIICLPALSQELEVAAIGAMCLFCVRDGDAARNHWSLLLTLLRCLRQSEVEGSKEERGYSRAKAAVAGRTLSDCARLYGDVSLDREEVLSAALALAAVPFTARHVVIEPLCGWLLNLGHIFFEEHLREPVLEVQWALGWLLVEAFKQRRSPDPEGDAGNANANANAIAIAPPEGRQRGGRGNGAGAAKAAAKTKSRRGTSWVARPQPGGTEMDGEPAAEDDGEEAMAAASQLTQFFNLLPKLPGKHGAPMLSLAVESVAESGLWRRATLTPHVINGQTRWLRGFSWPALFAFAHERLPAEMRFRIWKCALQLCIASPILATVAEVPFALCATIAEAPAGVAELVMEAVALGADKEALAPLLARLPAGEKREVQTPQHLLPANDSMAAEAERRQELQGLGVCVEAWAPSDVEAPGTVPPHLRMRMGRGRGRGRAAKPENTIEVPSMAPSYQEQEEAFALPKPKRRRQIDWAEKLAAEDAAEQVRLPLREQNRLNNLD